MWVRDLIIAPGREEHIGRHNVTIDEALEAVLNHRVVYRRRLKRYRVIGQTDAGRYFDGHSRGPTPSWRVRPGHSPRVDAGRIASLTARQIMNRTRIPKFKSIQEEAEFWDTHDTTEFEDEWIRVPEDELVRTGPRRPVTIRLDSATYAKLSRVAKANKTPISTLANIWVVERARKEAAAAKKQARPAGRRRSA